MMMMKSLLLVLLLPAKSSLALVDWLPSRNDFLVEGLDEIEPAYGLFDGTMYAGLLPVEEYNPNVNNNNNNNKNDNKKPTTTNYTDDPTVGKYMFWLFEPEEPELNDSIVFWFNGGPGCSSFHAGMLLEMGPVTTPLHPAGYFGPPQDANGPFVHNDYAWTRVTTVVYVEQPAPVGFSHGGREPLTENDIGHMFHGFLQNFMTVFGEEQREKRLFLVGESYAGMYIPSVAHAIYKANTQRTKAAHATQEDPLRLINLRGIAVGNGWADPLTQGPFVIDYAWWHGMIDSVTKDALHQAWEQCQSSQQQQAAAGRNNKNEPQMPPPFHDFTTPDECGTMDAVLKAAGAGLLPRGNPNTYDVTTWDPYDILNAKNNSNVQFFNNLDVQKALHVHPLGEVWMGCIPGAGRRRRRRRRLQQRRQLHLLDNDRPISVVPYIAELLDEANIQVLIYNGDRDMSVCAQGSEIMLNQMEWSGQDHWLDPNVYRRGLWIVENNDDANNDENNSHPQQSGQQSIMAGYAKMVHNLQFLVVYNSGHLVPYNQPQHSLDLIRRVVHEKRFVDRHIPMVYTPPVPPRAGSANRTRETDFNGSSSLEDTIILVFVSFAFGYATSIVLSRLNGWVQGYERIPHHHSHHGGNPRSRSNSRDRMPTSRSSSRLKDER